jgi:hypothetical protein
MSRSRPSSRGRRPSRGKSRKSSRSNSPTFYSRLRSLSPKSRVPAKKKGEDPRHHSDLFTDENPKGTVHGLRFRNKEESIQSVQNVKTLKREGKITHAHAVQIAITMSQRAKYHAHPTPGIKEGYKVWKAYKDTIVKI